MTESEWLAFIDSDELWDSVLWEKASERKCALYAVACARRIWHLFPDDASRRVVETLKQLADGCCTESDLEAACDARFEASTAAEIENLPKAQAMAHSVVVGFRFDHGGRLVMMAEHYSRAAAEASAAASASPTDHLLGWHPDDGLMKELLTHLYRPIEWPPLRLSPAIASLA
jgi:hypothetical protein